MSESINWKSVIPNFQEGDIITPFGSIFIKQRKDDFIVDGGIDHRDTLEKCASVRRKNSQMEGVYSQDGEQFYQKSLTSVNQKFIIRVISM